MACIRCSSSAPSPRRHSGHDRAADAAYISRLRSLAIVAHVDSGKSVGRLLNAAYHSALICRPDFAFLTIDTLCSSFAQTLSDAFLRHTGAIAPEKLDASPQFLDNLSVERDRGITIKMRAARMTWGDHVIQIVDTPGHCDFATQVSQSLQAVEGVLLLLDATKGVQAQTVANLDLALAANLTIIPVINKIDLPTADTDAVIDQLYDILPFDPTDSVILTSAKARIGVSEALDAIVARIPPPSGSPSEPLQALIFDTYFDSYRGIVVLVRIVNGAIRVGDPVRTMVSSFGRQQRFVVDSVGFLMPHEVPCTELQAGDVGYFTAASTCTSADCLARLHSFVS
jgi:GTP-binding protein LepA